METVLLAVKKTAEDIQEAEGGIKYLTSADFAGAGGGGGGGGDITNKTGTVVIEYDDIANCPVSPANSAAAWNTALATTAIDTVNVSGNIVTLTGNGKIFDFTCVNIDGATTTTGIKSIIDKDGLIATLANNAFAVCADRLENLHLTVTTIPDCSDILTVLNNVSIDNAKITGVEFLNSSPNLNGYLCFPELEIAGDSFLYGLSGTNNHISLPSLIHANDFVLCDADCVSLHIPNCLSVKRSFLDISNSTKVKSLSNLQAYSLESAGLYFLYGAIASDASLHLESLKAVGTGSFGGHTGISCTVYTNSAFYNTSAPFQAFLAANPSVVVVLVDADRVSKTFTNPTLTTSNTAGSWVSMEGYNNLELVLTLGSISTPPVVALEVSYDGTNSMRIGTITGVANSSKSISDAIANAKYLRYYVVSGGSSIGAGASIQLFATKS